MDESIMEAMLKQHAKINRLLEIFEASVLASSGEMKKNFEDLRVYLKQHFYIEDEAVFSIFTNMKGSEISIIFDLMQEHGILTGNISDLEKAMVKNQPIDLAELKKNLCEHQEIEEKLFYPTLEKELNENQKVFMTNRLEEMSKRFSRF